MGPADPDFNPMKSADDVNYTISQDRTAGQYAQEESDYKLLAGLVSNPAKSVSKLLPRPIRPPAPDYQEQFMILLEQNKKRLQDKNDMSGDMVKRPHGAAFEESDDDHETEGREENDKDGNYDGASKTQRRSPLIPPSKRPKETHDIPFDVDQDASTSDESYLATNAKPNGYGFYILHRVVCSDAFEFCHRRLYEDEPRIMECYNYHLSGRVSVTDLDDFIDDHNNTPLIIIRDFYCPKGNPSSMAERVGQYGTKHFREFVSIVSEDLRATIRRISKFASDKYSYEPRSDPVSPGIFTSPALSMSRSEYSLIFLYHHRQELAAEAEKANNGCALRTLASYIRNKPNAMYTICDNLFSQGLVSRDTLPWLFQPNEILVSSQGPLVMAYILRESPEEGSHLEFSCWNWGYNGQCLRRKDKRIKVSLLGDGEVRIDSLILYPLRYATKETKKRLVDNGESFWSVTQPKFVSYEGPDYLGDRVFPSDSRFMLDYQIYSKFHSISEAFTFSTRRKAPYDSWPDSIPNTAQLPPIHKVLLPAGIHGFFLKEKKWIHLRIDRVQAVSWNKTAFDRLVLPKKTKSLVKALVMVRKRKLENASDCSQEQTKQDDIIVGKGNGLIMLLHGGPGTGKTLTAGNSVADLAEMPLYSVTCGDIGTSPEAVEKYLNTVLHLGKKWNCVLLLDEADVFLEERSLSDLERNSLVSVFLRTLEYYEGVLILTSNRVGTFDEAFKSRIQLALQYRPLDKASRHKIWNNFLNMLRDNIKVDGGDNGEKEAVDFDDITAHMDELSQFEMNGRQIRNSLATARQLALFEHETLDWERIKDAIEVASDFNNYIKEVHGHTDEQWVRDNKYR
ncbi:P-loop containing nucleoside triphosphate hydrolase protein [Apiospora arundinis]